MRNKIIIQKNRHVTFFVYFLFTCLFFFVSGCKHSEKEMRTYVDNSLHWKIVEKCGYEHCYPKVDFLTNDDMIIRLEYDSMAKEEFFVIRTGFTFISGSFEYTPSEIKIRLKSGETLKQKTFTCSYTIWDRNYLRSQAAIAEPIIINKNANENADKHRCYLLFFDHQVLPTTEEIIMDMNGAITQNGETIKVPLIHFKKNPFWEK